MTPALGRAGRSLPLRRPASGDAVPRRLRPHGKPANAAAGRKGKTVCYAEPNDKNVLTNIKLHNKVPSEEGI